MSASWAGLEEEMRGVRQACANLGTPGALAEYVYHRLAVYEGRHSLESAATALISTAIQHWKPPEEGADEAPSIREIEAMKHAADKAGAFADQPARSTVHHALLQHAHLYHNNAAFKLSVDTLIPLMIDALAMKAERDWAKHEALVKEIMESRGRPIVVPEGFLDDFDPDEGFNPATGQPR